MKNILLLLVSLIVFKNTYANTINTPKYCGEYLVKMSLQAELTEDSMKIITIMSKMRLFFDHLSQNECPIQSKNFNYLVLKMDELIGYDSHPGVDLKSFDEIRNLIKAGKLLSEKIQYQGYLSQF